MRGVDLPAGRYEVVDGLDGQPFLIGPDGGLVEVDPADPNIVIEEN